MSYDSKEDLHARSLANGMKSSDATNSGDPQMDISVDLDRAATAAKEAVAKYPGRQVGIVVSPGIAFAMALISIKVVGGNADKLSHLNVLTTTLRLINAAHEARGSIKLSAWDGVPVFVDARVDYINVGVLSQEPIGVTGGVEEHKTTGLGSFGGDYGRGRDAGIN